MDVVDGPVSGNVNGATVGFVQFAPANHGVLTRRNGEIEYEPGFPPWIDRAEPLHVDNPTDRAQRTVADFFDSVGRLFDERLVSLDRRPELVLVITRAEDEQRARILFDHLLESGRFLSRNKSFDAYVDDSSATGRSMLECEQQGLLRWRRAGFVRRHLPVGFGGGLQRNGEQGGLYARCSARGDPGHMGTVKAALARGIFSAFAKGLAERRAISCFKLLAVFGEIVLKHGVIGKPANGRVRPLDLWLAASDDGGPLIDRLSQSGASVVALVLADAHSKGAPRSDAGVRADEPASVFLHNDDYTTQEFVLSALINSFRLSEADAMRVMLETHHKGRGVVTGLTFGEALQVSRDVMDDARDLGFPLLLTCHRAEDSSS